MKKREEIRDFRQLIEVAERGKPNHIVYQYKKDIRSENPEYIKIKYIDFKEDIKNMSTALLHLGLENQRIILVGNNRYEWCVSYLAITTGNMIVIPIDRALPDKEMETLIKRSGATAIIFESEKEELVRKIIKQEDNSVSIAIHMDLEKEDKEVKSFKQLLQEGREKIQKGDTKYDEIEIDNKKMSIMLFTSGTTNAPKAVMLSQYNICSNIVSLSRYIKLYTTDTLLSFLPIHHTFECTITFLFGFYWGATVAFCDGLKYIQKNLKEYKISVFVAVPLILENMYKKIQKGIEEKGKTEVISIMSKISNTLLKFKIDVRKIVFKQILDNFGGNLRVVLYGAAPMDKETILGYRNLGVDLIQGYGLTETSPVISAETDKRKRPGSVGLVLDNLQIKIEEPDKESVGEIAVKGPSVMIGYEKSEEETQKVLKDGWFYTGDYGYIDEDGFLFVTGRKKDIIVLKNGKNVYPQEIEFLINKIPYVVESLVYQREQSKTDTMLCAKIVYDQDRIKEVLGEKTEKEYQEILWKEIKQMNQTLPNFKHIKKITITKEPLAKTTTQKVKRYEELKMVN